MPLSARLRDLDLDSSDVDDECLASRRHDLAHEEIRLAEEVGDEGGLRKLIEFLGCAHLFDLALVHDGDRVGHGHGLLLVMRHMQECQTDFALDGFEFELHLTTKLEVECAQWLVEQKERWTVDDRSREGNSLLLSPGELLRFAGGEMIEFYEAQCLVSLSDGVRYLPAPQTEGDVLQNSHVGKQRVALEDRVDGALERLHRRHVFTADEDASRRGLFEPSDKPQGRRLAAARRSEKSEERSGRDGEIKVFDGGEAGEPLVDSYELEVSPRLRESATGHQAPSFTRWNSPLNAWSSAESRVRKM